MRCYSVLLVITVATTTAPASAQRYRIANLTESLDSQQSWARDLNDEGQVVGAFMTDGWKRTHGFVWQDGAVVEVILPQPHDRKAMPPTAQAGHRHVDAAAITADGVVGGRWTSQFFGLNFSAYFTPVPSPGLFPVPYLAQNVVGNAQLNDLAGEGVALAVGAGYRNEGAEVQHRGFANPISLSQGYMAGAGKLIPPFGMSRQRSYAWATSRDGLVVGWAERARGAQHAFAWDYDTEQITGLGTLGGPASAARDVNGAGQIVGWADAHKGRRHAFLHQDGLMTDLGTLGGATSEAWGINDAGQVVGWSWNGDGEIRAFIYDSGEMIDLNDRVPPGSGWTLQYAAAINSRGDIVGWGRFNGASQAFLLHRLALGDLNCDGSLDAFDIEPFIDAMLDPAGYRVRFPDCDPMLADVNGDGVVDAFDIEPFIQLLTGP